MTPNQPIPYAKQIITEDDVQAVVATLKSDWLTQGPTVKQFEEALANYCGAKYAVAVCNGTAALHLAMMAIGINPGDKVITTPNTFVATSNSIVYAGGLPVFADIEADSFNIDPNEILKKIAEHKDVKGIVPVHFAGLPADMEVIHQIAKKFNLWIIEDACHALGGVWLDSRGRAHKMGDGFYSDMTVFSFHPVKQVAAGEGGAIVTNDENLYEKLLLLRNHGITKNANTLTRKDGHWYYEMQDLGFNYRMSDIHATLGLVQLKKNDAWVRRRRELVRNYDEAFLPIDAIRHQLHPANGKLSYHLYVIQTNQRKALYDFLREKGIFTQVHYIPVHRHPFYQKRYGYKVQDYPVAEEYYCKALSLPLFPSLGNDEQDYVISAVMEFCHESAVHC